MEDRESQIDNLRQSILDAQSSNQTALAARLEALLIRMTGVADDVTSAEKPGSSAVGVPKVQEVTARDQLLRDVRAIRQYGIWTAWSLVFGVISGAIGGLLVAAMAYDAYWVAFLTGSALLAVIGVVAWLLVRRSDGQDSP